MKILNFKDFSILESLPRQQTVDQLKRLRKLTKGIDIGDRISDLNKQGANLQYYRNTIDSGIESYEDFEKKNKKFVSSWNLKGMMSPFSKSGKANESFVDKGLLKDLLLELEDDGWNITYESGTKGFSSNVIEIKNNLKPSQWVETPFSDIKDNLLRIKDYLGERFYKCLIFTYTSPSENINKGIELEDFETNKPIWKIIIRYYED